MTFVAIGALRVKKRFLSYRADTNALLTSNQDPFPTIHNKCLLFSRLLICFDSLQVYCKQYGSRSEEQTDQGSYCLLP